MIWSVLLPVRTVLSRVRRCRPEPITGARPMDLGRKINKGDSPHKLAQFLKQSPLRFSCQPDDAFASSSPSSSWLWIGRHASSSLLPFMCAQMQPPNNNRGDALFTYDGRLASFTHVLLLWMQSTRLCSKQTVPGSCPVGFGRYLFAFISLKPPRGPAFVISRGT